MLKAIFGPDRVVGTAARAGAVLLALASMPSPAAVFLEKIEGSRAGAPGGGFGTTVAIDGSTMIASAVDETPRAVYVFIRSG
jgi:hypothetical protein